MADELRPSKVKSLEEYEHTLPEQMLLFQIGQPSPYSNTIDLYDAVPKYVARAPRGAGKYVDPVERSFVHNDHRYRVTIKPARIRGRDGAWRDRFPGEREEILEEVLRKIASDEEHGRFLDDEAAVVFTIRQVRKELEARGHTLSHDEIKEALRVCAGTELSLSTEDGDLELTFHLFETVGVSSKERGGNAFVRFNTLVTRCITKGTFRQFDYEKVLSYENVLARRLHKRLAHNFLQASVTKSYDIWLRRLLREAGITIQKRWRDNVAYAKEALQELVEKDVLLSYTITPGHSQEESDLENAKLSLKPTPSFVNEIVRANRQHRSKALSTGR